MRVLFAGDALHVAMPAGRFVVRGSDEAETTTIEWLTEYAPLVQHAGDLEDEILAPGRIVPDGARDVLALPDGRLAVAYESRVDVLDAAGTVETSAVLEGDGTRLPGIAPKEAWQKETRFAGHSRGIRLSPAPGGFLVTANESGHVARFSLEERRFVRVLRVPGAPENTVYAAVIGDDLLVGMKWNGRHSDLFLVSPGDELVARWPSDGEVRWGMPAPAIVGDAKMRHVVTYSDDGPNARKLALLSLPELEEIDHAEIGSWPMDLATDGSRFAAVAGDLLVIGRVEGARLVLDSQWTQRDILRKAGVKSPALPTAATDDGRGQRVWLKGKIDTLRLDGERVLIESDGGVFDVTSGERQTILSPIRRKLHDVRGDRLVVTEGNRFRLLVGLQERMRIEPTGDGFDVHAWLFEDGVVHVDRDTDDIDDHFTLTWCPPSGTPKELATSVRSLGVSSDFVLARNAREVVWFELQREDNEYEYWLVRWSPHAKGSSERLERPVTALTFDGDTLFAKTDLHSEAHLHRVEADGTLLRITKEPLPYFSRGLAVGGGRAYVTTATSSSGAGIHPSQLFAIDLATGAQTVIATAVVGELGSVTVSGGRVWWLESPTNGVTFASVPKDEELSSICSMAL